MYYVYVATNKTNGMKYVGVTNDLTRRIKEHLRAEYKFGKELRKLGKESFTFELIPFDTVDEAYEFEGLMVGIEEVNSGKFYNMIPGGIPNGFYGDYNPMRRQEVKDKHPSLFSADNNTMNSPESKQKMVESQNRKRVIVGFTVYSGVREAARCLGMSRQKLVHRLKSNNFPDHQYFDKDHSGEVVRTSN